MEKEILKELKLIRFMLEDVWLSCDIVKKDGTELKHVYQRLQDEMKADKPHYEELWE